MMAQCDKEGHSIIADVRPVGKPFCIACRAWVKKSDDGKWVKIEDQS